MLILMTLSLTLTLKTFVRLVLHIFIHSLLLRYCGLSMPDTTTSSGNSLRVVFSTDWSVTYQGFSAFYKTYDPYSGQSAHRSLKQVWFMDTV